MLKLNLASARLLTSALFLSTVTRREMSTSKGCEVLELIYSQKLRI